METLGNILKKLQLQNTSNVTVYPKNKIEPESGEKTNSEFCPLCEGRGWVRSDVPLGHANFGKALQCTCQATATLAKRIKSLQQFSNLGNFGNLTFETLPEKARSKSKERQKKYTAALKYSESYARNLKGWLILSGSSGSGKTQIAAAIANNCLQQGQPVFFVGVADLLDHLRTTFSPKEDVSYDELFEQVRSVPVLILDDFRTPSISPWAEEKLYQILNYRSNSKSPTIITTSIPIHQTNERFKSRFEDLTLSKILDLGWDTKDYLVKLGLIHPTMLKNMSFQSFNPSGNNASLREQETLRAAMNAAKSFSGYPQGWLVLLGDSGVGKTHLAVAIAGEQLNEGHDVFFTSTLDLLDNLRRTFGSQSFLAFDELFEQVKQTPLLIMDDFQFENSSSWSQEKLYQIIVHRHNAELPTIITARLLDTANDPTDKLSPRDPIVSRLNDARLVSTIPIQSGDYRNQGRKLSSKITKPIQ